MSYEKSNEHSQKNSNNAAGSTTASHTTPVPLGALCSSETAASPQLLRRNSMPKRLTDTAKWDDPWFRKLPTKYKSLWTYICDKCDLTGVWKVDFEMASFVMGEKIDEKEAFNALNFEKERVTQLKRGNWLINDFVEFQYGVLGEKSPIHLKVLSLIDSHRVSIGYTIPCNKNKKEKYNKKEIQGIPESLKEVKDYFLELQKPGEAETFYDYFCSNGWKVGGRAPMKDWKASARNWLRRNGHKTAIKQSTLKTCKKCNEVIPDSEMKYHLLKHQSEENAPQEFRELVSKISSEKKA